jgi:hypothetical protein
MLVAVALVAFVNDFSDTVQVLDDVKIGWGGTVGNGDIDFGSLYDEATDNRWEFVDGDNNLFAHIVDGGTEGTATWNGTIVGQDVTATEAESGGTVIVTASNTSNTASSDAAFVATAGGSSGGDAYQRFSITGAGVFTWGIDNSDGDAWVLSQAAALGTTNRIKVDGGTGDVDVFQDLDVGGDLTITGATNLAGLILTGDLAVNGGDITSSAATFNVGNVTPTTFQMAGGASTATNIGHASGPLTVAGDLRADGGDIGTSTDPNLLDIGTDDELTINGALQTVLTSGLWNNTGNSLIINNTRATGNSVLTMNAIASDNAGEARLRYGRTTNTSGTRTAQWYACDGTATVTAQLTMSTGALQLDAGLTTEGNSTFGNASTDTTTNVGRMIHRSVTDAGPMTATAGTTAEIVYNTADSMFYGAQTTASPAAWALLSQNVPAYSELYSHNHSGDTLTITTALQWEPFTTTTVGTEDSSNNAVGSTANDEITIGANGGGVYDVDLTIAMSNAGGADAFQFGIVINFQNGAVATSNNAGGLIEVVTSAAHNLATGQQVEIIGHDEASVNGEWTITVVDADEFTLDGSTYVGDGSGGVFSVAPEDNTRTRRDMSAGGDTGSASTSGLLTLVATDTVSWVARNDTDTDNITVWESNLHVTRID